MGGFAMEFDFMVIWSFISFFWEKTSMHQLIWISWFGRFASMMEGLGMFLISSDRTKLSASLITAWETTQASHFVGVGGGADAMNLSSVIPTSTPRLSLIRSNSLSRFPSTHPSVSVLFHPFSWAILRACRASFLGLVFLVVSAVVQKGSHTVQLIRVLEGSMGVRAAPRLKPGTSISLSWQGRVSLYRFWRIVPSPSLQGSCGCFSGQMAVENPPFWRCLAVPLFIWQPLNCRILKYQNREKKIHEFLCFPAVYCQVEHRDYLL